MKHLLSIEAMDTASIKTILENATVIKAQRGDSQHHPLAGQTWAKIFTKSSTRTRVSFETGIRELGGGVMFLNANDLQLGRGEPIQDTARVLGRMVHGAVIRTFAQSDVEDFAEHSGIPTINALPAAAHRGRTTPAIESPTPHPQRTLHKDRTAARAGTCSFLPISQ